MSSRGCRRLADATAKDASRRPRASLIEARLERGHPTRELPCVEASRESWGVRPADVGEDVARAWGDKRQGPGQSPCCRWESQRYTEAPAALLRCSVEGQTHKKGRPQQQLAAAYIHAPAPVALASPPLPPSSLAGHHTTPPTHNHTADIHTSRVRHTRPRTTRLSV